MKLIVIRHGAYQDLFDEQGRKLVHTPESPLNELGTMQTHQLGEIFTTQGITFDAVYTSPFRRAKETADILASDLHVQNVSEVDGLKDVFPNSANGKPWEKLEQVDGDIYNHPLDNDPQESLVELVERARKTLQRIITEAQERGYQSIALISHGDTISAIDWVLHNSEHPTSYKEMKNAFYLQKGEAFELILDENMRLQIEGEIIISEAAKVGTEGFRGSRKETKNN